MTGALLDLGEVKPGTQRLEGVGVGRGGPHARRGRTRVARGGGPVTLRERLSIPQVPAATGSFVVSLAVGLDPALNEEAPSSYDVYDIELIPCEQGEPDELRLPPQPSS